MTDPGALIFQAFQQQLYDVGIVFICFFMWIAPMTPSRKRRSIMKFKQILTRTFEDAFELRKEHSADSLR